MLRKFAQKRARAMGFNVTRATAIGHPLEWLLGFARQNGVTTILDVGANVGQFAKSVSAAGWKGKILSFEPLAAAHAQLLAASANNPQWTIAGRGALGATAGTAEINVAGNSQSSSLLPMLNRHSQAAPTSAYVATEAVPVTPLDKAIANLDTNEVFLLKMDVQGFESEVLRGAKETFCRTPIIYSEMSLQPLYSGEKLFTDLASEIIELGYRCIGIQPGYVDPSNLEMLQVDATFLRNVL